MGLYEPITSEETSRLNDAEKAALLAKYAADFVNPDGSGIRLIVTRNIDPSDQPPEYLQMSASIRSAGGKQVLFRNWPPSERQGIKQLMVNALHPHGSPYEFVRGAALSCFVPL
jgi:hypothetical protein